MKVCVGWPWRVVQGVSRVRSHRKGLRRAARPRGQQQASCANAGVFSRSVRS
jgi:hypothetical protein